LSYTLVVDLLEEIARTERELAELRDRRVVLDADIHATEERLRVLRRSLEGSGDLAGMKRTDAILAVLRDAGESLSPKEIGERLVAGGQPATAPNAITATLNHLLAQGRISRNEKRYMAV
jgi:hypothetical protein